MFSSILINYLISVVRSTHTTKTFCITVKKTIFTKNTVRIESLDGVKNLSRAWVLYKKF